MHLVFRLESTGFILRFFPLLIYSAIPRIVFLDSIFKLIFKPLVNLWNSFTIPFIFSLSSLFNSDSSLYNFVSCFSSGCPSFFVCLDFLVLVSLVLLFLILLLFLVLVFLFYISYFLDILDVPIFLFLYLIFLVFLLQVLFFLDFLLLFLLQFLFFLSLASLFLVFLAFQFLI